MTSPGLCALATSRSRGSVLLLFAASVMALPRPAGSLSEAEAGSTPTTHTDIGQQPVHLRQRRGVGLRHAGGPLRHQRLADRRVQYHGIKIVNTDKNVIVSDITIVGEADAVGYSIYIAYTDNIDLDHILDKRNNATPISAVRGPHISDYVQTRGASTGMIVGWSDDSILSGSHHKRAHIGQMRSCHGQGTASLRAST